LGILKNNTFSLWFELGCFLAQIYLDFLIISLSGFEGHIFIFSFLVRKKYQKRGHLLARDGQLGSRS
jgi:hypothetical protein